MAKTDVEFSIGADNTPLKRELEESKQLVKDQADETQAYMDKVRGSTEEAAEASFDLADSIQEITANWAPMTAAAVGFLTVINETIKASEELFGLNEAYKTQLEQINKLMEARTGYSDRILENAKAAATLEERDEILGVGFRESSTQLKARERELQAARQAANWKPRDIPMIGGLLSLKARAYNPAGDFRRPEQREKALEAAEKAYAAQLKTDQALIKGTAEMTGTTKQQLEELRRLNRTSQKTNDAINKLNPGMTN